MEFENEMTATFTMCAFTVGGGRTIKLMGTKGQLRGNLEKSEIEITDFGTGDIETINLKVSNDSHAGGDTEIMKDFTELVRDGGKKKSLTSASVSVQSHLMAFAAEKSRLESKVINIREYIEELRNNK